ncbi:MAG: xanthine dehydrogenase family protein [Acidimicrobiales bacterium]
MTGSNDTGMGHVVARLDAEDKTTGAAEYPGDRWPEGVAHAVIVFTDQPHARITKLDTAAAEAADGVLLVITAADVPVNEYGLTMADQPVLIGPVTSGRSAVPADVSRWEADQLAVVVADTAAQALAAAALIETEWEELPILADLDAALADGAPMLHPENGQGSNAYYHLVVRKGDVAEAFARADVVVEGTYEFPYQEHAYLQPEAALAYVDDEGRPTVEIAGQWTHEDREQIAHALDLPDEAVRVIYPSIGGAFGGREDMSMQIVLALAAQRLWAKGIERPIRSQWSREESIVGHHKRHRGRVHARLAATKDGLILGVEADGYLDAGSYNYTSNKVLGNMHLTVAGPYEVPNARIDSYAVYTNAVPGGAFRGFGGPQGCFVSESQMNKLAEATGIDPVEIRRRNALGEGSIGITGTEMPPGVSIPEVIEACAEAASWEEPPKPVMPIASFASLPPTSGSVRRGRGFACAYKNVGFSFGFPNDRWPRSCCTPTTAPMPTTPATGPTGPRCSWPGPR